MGRRKPNLKLDISQNNSAPPNKSRSPGKPNGRKHTTYVDLVRQLRNPAGAVPLTKWMETGRPVDRPLGSSMPKQKVVTPRRKEPKTPVQDYTDYFDEDLSGSLNVSTSGPVYDDEEMAKKVQENNATFEKLTVGTYKKPPMSEESSSKE
ncbi:hypothetical protein B5807_08834 [Epicoccum nigrum]|uniref:Uncharacterized protein n=1 Tax=Epicoccum nigrum TaxID=105696 RepID=A0A1Y2LST6_EPING|nr:hypothetical protein B5807_08834 [Epicoccum nigrum]